MTFSARLVNPQRVDLTQVDSAMNVFTTTNGAPVLNPAASQRIGDQLRATTLIQDINLLELIQHLDRERIPERVVHARGCGAFGYFEATVDMTDVTGANFMSSVGKKTPLFARFSTTVGEKGSPESVRDARGFAFKIFTEEGNLDWVFLSTPVFPIRDGAKFPSFVHATKKNPKSGLPDHTMFWDYFNNNPEAVHFLMFHFSDRATPSGFQHADIFSVNTYRFTRTDGNFVYVKIHMKSNQGNQYLTNEEARKLAGDDPDAMTRTMYNDIEAGKFPSWDVYGQIIDPLVAERYPINVFDPTKTLPSKDFPYRPFGRILLNRNVDDFFAETEQSAFSPTNVVPGWALSPDPILQSRALAYPDAQRYRLGTNFFQLPINKSVRRFNPLIRDGAGCLQNLGSVPPYYPSRFYNAVKAPQYAPPPEETWSGRVVDFESKVAEDDFAQPRDFWERILAKDPGQQDNFVNNIAEHLGQAIREVREKSYALFSRVHRDLGRRIQIATEAEAARIALSKVGDTQFALPFSSRSSRTAVDGEESLPCSLDPCAPNSGLLGSHRTAFDF